MSAESFDFSLENILKLRQETEKERAALLARARRDSRGAQETRDDLEDLRSDGRRRVSQERSRGNKAGLLWNLSEMVERLDERVRSAEEVCRQAEAEVVQQLRQFHDAFQARRALDELRRRRMEEWRVERARRDQRDLDEIALVRFGRDGSDPAVMENEL